MQKYELTPDIIETLKKQFPGKALYRKELFGQEYVFTGINRAEYKTILERFQAAGGNLNQIDILDDLYVEKAMLWPVLSPEDQVASPAGIMRTLSNLIQEKSCLVPPQTDPAALVSFTLIKAKTMGPKPSEDELATLKAKCPWPLHQVFIDSDYYIVRPLVRLEWNQIQQLPEETDMDEAILEKSVLWPAKIDWSQKSAGVIASLARQTLYFSGFNDNGEVTEL